MDVRVSTRTTMYKRSTYRRTIQTTEEGVKFSSKRIPCMKNEDVNEKMIKFLTLTSTPTEKSGGGFFLTDCLMTLGVVTLVTYLPGEVKTEHHPVTSFD